MHPVSWLHVVKEMAWQREWLGWVQIKSGFLLFPSSLLHSAITALYLGNRGCYLTARVNPVGFMGERRSDTCLCFCSAFMGCTLPSGGHRYPLVEGFSVGQTTAGTQAGVGQLLLQEPSTCLAWTNGATPDCVCKMNECKAQRMSRQGYAPTLQTFGCFPSEVQVPVSSSLKNRTMGASADGNLQCF